MTLVVIPDECQSMPMTAPNDWNQNGCDSRPKEFIPAVMMDDRLGDDGAERRHARRQPRRNASTVKRKIGTAATSCHLIV